MFVNYPMSDIEYEQYIKNGQIKFRNVLFMGLKLRTPYWTSKPQRQGVEFDNMKDILDYVRNELNIDIRFDNSRCQRAKRILKKHGKIKIEQVNTIFK